jgi:hypothetical protein
LRLAPQMQSFCFFREVKELKSKSPKNWKKKNNQKKKQNKKINNSKKLILRLMATQFFNSFYE